MVPMFKLSVFLIYLTSILCFSPILIKGTCYQSPIKICKSSSAVGIVANSTNINFLLKILRAKNIESAYVYGWEDHNRIMVLFRNGALVPYIPNRIISEYAFCYGACPCPQIILNVKSCCTHKDPPIETCRVPSENTCGINDSPCTKVDTPKECNTYSQPCKIEVLNPCSAQVSVPVPCKEDHPCKPIEDSEIVSTCIEISDECCMEEEYSTTERSCIINHYDKKSENINSTIKKIQYRSLPKKYLQSKTYEYDCQDNELVLKIKEEIVTINKINDDLKEKKLDIPSILYNPNFLFNMKKKIEKKYKHEVCLYVKDDNLLIVEIKGRFYYLKCYAKSNKRKKYHLKKIDDKKRKEIICDGIHMVVFNYEIITQ